MEKNKKITNKTLVLLIVAGLIIISFISLKIKEIYQSREEIIITPDPLSINSETVFSQNKTGNIKKFSSYDELLAFVDNNKNIQSKDYHKMRLGSDLAVNESIPMTESIGLGSSDVDFSTTNIQVLGVDEADIIKTDGQYIYAVVDKDLYIIESYPVDNFKIVNKLSFDDYLTDIFIKNNKLVVFGEKADLFIMEKMALSSMIWPGPYKNNVFVKIFDISNKENPIEKRDVQIEGAYFNSRLIGDHLYFIVNNYSFDDNILPRISYQGSDLEFCKSSSAQSGCSSPDIYYFDTYYDSLNFTSIFSLNVLNDEEEMRSSFYLLPSGQNLYVSLNNIYITYTKYLNEYDLESEILLEIIYSRLSEKDKELIDEINKVSDKILSLIEKKNKIRTILDSYVNYLNISEQEALIEEMTSRIKQKHPNLKDDIETSIIYKIAVFNGIIEPISEGVVSGSILNQFSMDEYNGYFRVATTKNISWSRYIKEEDQQSHSNLYVLDDNMQTIGEIKNLAPDERIYSVRFLGDQAFVVTFKQVDPLFSIDLKNPYSPRVLGELKIPGFSNYLHPYGDDMLIGFGKDTDLLEGDRVVSKGLKLSLFDISQDNPIEVDAYIIGDAGSESIALYDHRAFLFSKNKNILVVPATLRDGSSVDFWGKTTFNGFLVFEIIDSKFNLKGRVDHLGDIVSSFDDFMNYSAKRALYIDDNLYSFSDKMIKVNKIEDLVEISSIRF